MRESHFVGVAAAFVIMVDGVEHFALHSGDYTQFTVSSGTHQLAVKRWIALERTQVDETTLAALPGQTYYFVIGPPAMFGQAPPKEIERTEAERIIAAGHYVNPASVSGR